MPDCEICRRPVGPGGQEGVCRSCLADGAAWVRHQIAAICEQLAEAQQTLLGVAAYAARRLRETDGMWPPVARATECRRGLETIEAECRRVAAVANERGDPR